MNPEYYQTVPRKKEKTDLLLNDEFLDRFILDTQYCTVENIKEMFTQYDYVVFKPNRGGGGKNVGFVTKDNDGYNIQIDDRKYTKQRAEELYTFINEQCPKKKFILQKGVQLLKYNNSPFDIRIEVQKPYEKWIVTGIVAKTAAKNKLVTNRHSGGTGMLLETAFADISGSRLSEIKSLLKFVGMRTARLLNGKYEGLREVGIDMGFDKHYNPYILEINTKPQYGVFRQAGDEKMLKRITNCNKIIFDSIEYIKREL